MSIKQISFSPEFLSEPEIKQVSLSDDCQFSNQTDLSTIEYVPPPVNTMKMTGGGSEQDIVEQEVAKDLFNLELKPVSFNEQTDDEYSPPNSPGVTSGESFDTGEMPDSLQDLSSEQPANQAGGFDIQIDPDVTIDEVTNNQDNPGEDPDQLDDKIDENDNEYESNFDVNLSSRIKEVEDITKQMQQVRDTEEEQSLLNENIEYDIEFDLNTLNEKLSDEMNLYWSKELDTSYIESKVKEYINNYNSPEYKTYRSMLEYIMSKTKVGYTLTINKKGEYILHRGNIEKYDIKLTPPEYIYVDRALVDLEKDTNEVEFKLFDLKYELVENADKIMEDDLITFRQMQKKYYELIHKKAIFQEYLKQINKRDENEVQMYLNFMQKKTNQKNETIRVIETKYVYAPKTFQDDIRNSKIASLELYNQIKNIYQTNQLKKQANISKEEQKELNTTIKKYLTTGSASTTVNLIEQYNKKLQKEINFIIVKKPVVDVKKKDKDQSNKIKKDT